jgi:serine protease Do
LPLIQKVVSSLGNAQFSKPEKNISQVCQALRPAVVSLYAGAEIGSGSIISPTGLVLTNQNVVGPAANGVIRIVTWAGGFYTGQVVAADPINDLALVQLHSQDLLPTVPLAQTDAAEPGQPVCTVGNPHNRLGVVSRGRLLETDVNGNLKSRLFLIPGNSGGPLVNQQGELIGVNKSVQLLSGRRTPEISFATTLAIARTFIEQNRDQANAVPRSPLPQTALSSSAEVPVDFQLGNAGSTAELTSPSAMPPSPGLGVEIDRATFLIVLVEPNSPADRAGLSGGDRLIAINGQPIQHYAQLKAFFQHPIQSVVLTIERDQQQEQVKVSF